MKKVSIFSAMAAASLFLNACGVNTALVSNHNVNTTNVQLASNNFRVLEKVSGTSEMHYVFMIGGLNKKKLYENAYAKMMDNANLKGGAKAVTNAVTEEHFWGIPPIYIKRTITVSGNVIEFTK